MIDDDPFLWAITDHPGCTAAELARDMNSIGELLLRLVNDVDTRKTWRLLRRRVHGVVTEAQVAAWLSRAERAGLVWNKPAYDGADQWAITDGGLDRLRQLGVRRN